MYFTTAIEFEHKTISVLINYATIRPPHVKVDMACAQSNKHHGSKHAHTVNPRFIRG